MKEGAKTTDNDFPTKSPDSASIDRVEELIAIATNLARRAKTGTLTRSESSGNADHADRTPLNSIIEMTKQLSGADLTPEQVEYLTSLKSLVDSLMQLINDILDFAVVSSGKSELFSKTLSPVAEAAKLGLKRPGAPRREDALPSLGRTLNILLVEDNLVNQTLAEAILGSQGHRVITADNGREALDAVRTVAFDLVVMDVHMPVMDGLEATGAIREEESLTGRHVPIVALTANAMKGDRELCVAAGMDGYTTKPINRKALFTEIERVLSECSDRRELVS